MTIKKYTVLFVIILICLTIVGCRKSGPQIDSSEKSLKFVIPGKLTNFDPVDMRDHSTMQVASHIYETLYEYHYLKRPYELIPLLAAEMPQVSDDVTEYTIKIKKGVYFSDDKCFPDGKGRELKASDFVYSIKRIANIKNISRNWSIFQDRIVGLNDFREYTKTCETKADVDYSKPVEGLRAIDGYTLFIKLNKPWPQMLGTAFADIATTPIAKEAVDYYGKDLVSNPVGTGPFKLERWERSSYLKLVRNPAFRDEFYPTEGEESDKENGFLDDAGKKLPLVDSIMFTILEETQPEWLMFLQGRIDAIPIRKDTHGEILAQSGQLTPEMKKLGIEMKIFDEPSTFWVGFNMLEPVLGKNKPLRRAIGYAIDRQEFIDTFYAGFGKVAHGFICPQMNAYNPEIKEKGYSEHNIEKGEKLVKQAEQVHGGPIPVLKIAMAGTGTFYRQYGLFLQKQFEDIGLQLEVQYMDWPTYLEKVKTRSVQMFTAGSVASIPDAEDFLGLFISKNWAPGSNHFNYKNETYDRLYEQVSVMPDSPERRALYRQMELIVLEDYPAAFSCHRVIYRIHHGWIENYKQHAFNKAKGKYLNVDNERKAGLMEIIKANR